MTTKATATDRYGFPLRSCTRCGGTGDFGPRSVDGGRCFGCGGTGWVHPAGRVADAYAAMMAAARTAKRPMVSQMRPGDEVTFDIDWNGNATKDAAWKTVERIDITPEIVGRAWTGGELVRVSYRTTIYWTDGTFRGADENQQGARRGVKVTPRPYVAQALGLPAPVAAPAPVAKPEPVRDALFDPTAQLMSTGDDLFSLLTA